MSCPVVRRPKSKQAESKLKVAKLTAVKRKVTQNYVSKPVEAFRPLAKQNYFDYTGVLFNSLEGPSIGRPKGRQLRSVLCKKEQQR